MQTLTLGMVLPGGLGGRHCQLLNHPSGDPSAAFHRLEAPVVAPFSESSTWIYIVPLHPVVDDLESRSALKVEHDIGIWDVDLVFDHHPVRSFQNTGLAQRSDH